MRILSWNLWWRYGPWEQRREAIAATLAEVQPDVCGLQEVWGGPGENLAAELAGRLGMHWRWGAAAKARDAGGEELSMGNAVLSRWPIAAHAQASLTADGLTGESKVAVHARIEAPGGALPFVTTHLTYGPGLSHVRTEQVRKLAEFVAEHAADCAYPPVVTGDLNAEPASDELRLLGGLLATPAVDGLVLLDAWRYADPGDPDSPGTITTAIRPTASSRTRASTTFWPACPARAAARCGQSAWLARRRSGPSGHRIISLSSPTYSSRTQAHQGRPTASEPGTSSKHRKTLCLASSREKLLLSHPRRNRC